MKKIYLAARCALLVSAVLAAPGAYAQAAPKAGDACFKRVFEKTTSDGRWLVKECGVGEFIFLEVDFRDAKLQQSSARIDAGNRSGDTEDTGYTMLTPGTLSINMISERGGIVFVVHPASDSKDLSSIALPYMTPDEGGIFSLKRVGNTIRLKTDFDDVTVPVDSNGRFGKVIRAKVPEKK